MCMFCIESLSAYSSAANAGFDAAPNLKVFEIIDDPKSKNQRALFSPEVKDPSEEGDENRGGEVDDCRQASRPGQRDYIVA